MTSVDIEITELMKRHQHITKLQNELNKEEKFIDHQLDEAIAKQCHLEKKNKISVTDESCHTHNFISCENNNS